MTVMKKFILLTAACLALLFAPLGAQTVRLMTWNIRYDNPGDGENNWHKRKAGLIDLIRFNDPGIFGIQEGLHHQVAYIDSSLGHYAYYGIGRNDGKEKGEYSAVFYDSTVFRLLEQATFWLSETPEKVSVGWDAALERICTCTRFENKASGRQLWVFNTHFDHIGVRARRESARLILDRMDRMNKAGKPAVLMGDLNLEPETEAVQSILKRMNDTKDAATRVSFGPDATFNGFRFDQVPTRRIDYIFTGKSGISVLKYGVLTDSRDGRYYSDHFPVLAEIRLEGR